MMHSNETLSWAIYMANRWNINECAIVFNGRNNVDEDNWIYSLGWHIWEMWKEYCENYGLYAAPMRLLYELDNNNLDKLLNRACELYDGRQNRK